MKYYTVKEVAKILRIDVITVYEKINSGLLKAFRPARKYLISEVQLQEFLNDSLTA